MHLDPELFHKKVVELHHGGKGGLEHIFLKVAGAFPDGESTAAHAFEHLLQIDLADAVVCGNVLPTDTHSPQQTAGQNTGAVFSGGAVE